MYSQLLTFGTAFLGSAVESVEALTIVLAVGLTRGWRWPLYGTISALALLTGLVLAFGQLITTNIPEAVLKMVIGTLILLFGLRWLHKAVLRSAGVIALHDENAEYQETLHELEEAQGPRRDLVGFTLAFKGVFLEGVEVAFIVFAVGSSNKNLPIAAAGGVAAMVIVALVGMVVRHPLAMVPENTLKFSVGILLAALGTFWVAEGMGVQWPLDYVSILALAVLFIGAARLGVEVIKGRPQAAPLTAEVEMKYVRAAVSEVIGLFVSDWSQAIGILCILAAGYVATRTIHSQFTGFGIAGILGAHLILTTVTESRKRAATKRVVAARPDEPALTPGAGG